MDLDDRDLGEDSKKEEKKKVDLKNYVKNGEWELLGTKLIRMEQYYPNVEEAFPYISLQIR